MYSRVAVSLMALAPLALSLITRVRVLQAADNIARAHSQGSIRWGPATPRLSKKAYMGISQKPGSFGSPLQLPGTSRQLFAIPLSNVYGQNASLLGSVTGTEAEAEES